MRLDAGVNVGTQQAARDLMKTLADHYTETGGKGRILFTKDAATGDITGTDRSRGVWARMSSAVSDSYKEAKADFYAMVATAYPEQAGRILAHLDERQAASGVTDMLTPGMIKEAHEMATQGWPDGGAVADALTSPNGREVAADDFSAAIGLMKGGKKPDLGLTGEAGPDSVAKATAQRELAEPKNFTACHDTAKQLQEIMGKPETERNAGGAGRSERLKAIKLAIDTLESGTPSVISLKGTATADGHSFTLIARPDGKVDVLEAWASTEDGMDLASLLGQCKTGLDKDQVIEALNLIGSKSLADRTAGYTYLSTAYDTAARFELHHDPGVGERAKDCRDADRNIKLEVRARDLLPHKEVMDNMSTRLDKLAEYREDVLVTPEERDAYPVQMEKIRRAEEQFAALAAARRGAAREEV